MINNRINSGSLDAFQNKIIILPENLQVGVFPGGLSKIFTFGHGNTEKGVNRVFNTDELIEVLRD